MMVCVCVCGNNNNDGFIQVEKRHFTSGINDDPSLFQALKSTMWMDTAAGTLHTSDVIQDPLFVVGKRLFLYPFRTKQFVPFFSFSLFFILFSHDHRQGHCAYSALGWAWRRAHGHCGPSSLVHFSSNAIPTTIPFQRQRYSSSSYYSNSASPFSTHIILCAKWFRQYNRHTKRIQKQLMVLGFFNWQ